MINQLIQAITQDNIFQILERNKNPYTSVIGTLGTVEVVSFSQAPEQKLVLKTVHLHMFSEKAKRQFVKEIHFLTKNSSQYFLTLHKYLQTPTQGYMLLELCQKGNLFRYQASCPNVTVPLNSALKICADVMRGLYQLHKNGLLHRNLNRENVFVFWDQEGNEIMAKLADFGLSRSVGQVMAKRFSTEMYFAPEVFTDEKYGYGVDVWALGVLLYQMLTKVCPFYFTKQLDNVTKKQILISQTNNFTLEKFLKDIRDSPLNTQQTQNLFTIFSNIFLPEPSERMTMFEVMNHRLFDMHFMKHQELKELEAFYGQRGAKGNGRKGAETEPKIVNVGKCQQREVEERAKMHMIVMSQQPNGFLKNKDFTAQEQLLWHRLDHIGFLSLTIEHFQTSPQSIPQPELTCMLYNLSLYHICLLQNLTQSLTLTQLQSSYPQYRWIGFLQDVKFHEFTQECRKTLEVWRRKHEGYEKQCGQLLKEIGKKNRYFVAWWASNGKMERLKGLKDPLEDKGFKMAFRCSTVLCHNHLKQQLQSSPKGNKLYFSATIILLCHVFNNIFRTYKKDFTIFFQFIDQQRKISKTNSVHSEPANQNFVSLNLSQQISLTKLWKWLTERSIEQLTTVMKGVVREYFGQDGDKGGKEKGNEMNDI